MCTRIRSQMRLRGAHRTPQSKIIISRVCLFSSPSRSELLVAPPELFVPETPPQICSTINPRLDSLLESLEFSPQQLYSSIIPPTDFLVESFEYSSALTQESYFDIGESPVSPTIPSPAIESHLEFLGRTTGSSTSSSLTSSPETTTSTVTGSWDLNGDPIDPLWPNFNQIELVSPTEVIGIDDTDETPVLYINNTRDFKKNIFCLSPTIVFGASIQSGVANRWNTFIKCFSRNARWRVFPI